MIVCHDRLESLFPALGTTLLPRFRRFASMTVGAADDAFEDLRVQGCQARTFADQDADLPTLPPMHVVELQNDGVIDSAIDARVLAEVCLYESSVARAIPRYPFVARGVIGGAILAVIPAHILALTHLADRVTSARRFVSKRKLVDQLRLTAAPSSLHGESVRQLGASRLALPEELARPEGIEPPSFRLEGGCLIR
jgi:hypothetical protein